MSIQIRHTICETDPAAVRDIVASAGFFNPEEIDIAVELADEALANGYEKSGYSFVFMEIDGRTAGYACFGRIPGTQASFDLYWIAVHADFRGRGLGKQILREAESAIAGAGGKRIYIETSSQPKYKPTQGFYINARYELEAVLKDFYAPGDGKMMFVKAL